MTIEEDTLVKINSLFMTPISEESFIPRLIKIMEIVEGYKDLSGIEKKNIVKSVVKQLLQEQNVNFLTNDVVIDTIIDNVISVSKGLYILNESKIKAFFSKLFTCCK